MKKIFTFAAVVGAAMMMVSCGASRQVAQSAPAKSGNPFGDVYEAPCAEADSPEYFAATGIAVGAKARMADLQRLALANAQQVIRMKMEHAYKGAVDDYMNSVGTNAGTDIETKLEAGGSQIMDLVVNETVATCGPKYSSVDDKGNMTCYVGIRIPKKALVETIVDNVADNVSEEEELKIRFKEDEFRKRTLEKFQNYKEQN